MNIRTLHKHHYITCPLIIYFKRNLIKKKTSKEIKIKIKGTRISGGLKPLSNF